MKFYYSGKNPDLSGAIMVHSESCKTLPDVLGRIYIGMFPNGNLATQNAQEQLQLSKVKVCKCCL